MTNASHNLIQTLPLEFTDILPETVMIFKYVEKNGYIIYLSDNGFINSVNNIANESIGYIEVVFPENIFNRKISDKEKESILVFIKSNKKNKGIGTYLLLLYAWFSRQYGRFNISLDDDSDRSRDNSIYEQIGCNYIEPYPSNSPEMICNSKNILANYITFYNKYKNNGFFKEIKSINSDINNISKTIKKDKFTTKKDKFTTKKDKSTTKKDKSTTKKTIKKNKTKTYKTFSKTSLKSKT